MSDTNPSQSEEALGIGNIISETFSLFFGNFAFFFGVVAIPFLVINIAIQLTLPSLADVNDVGSIWMVSLGSSAFVMLGYIFLQGVIVRCAVALKTGQGQQLNLAIAATLKGFLPILLLGIASALLIGLGFIMLVIPGLYIAAILYVYIPSIVFEGRGFDAFSRSSDLTSGYRWAIIGLMIGVGILVWLVSFIAGLIFVFIPGVGYGDYGATNILGAVMEAVLQGITLPLSMIAAGLVFVRLREIKEGGVAEDLVRIFE